MFTPGSDSLYDFFNKSGVAYYIPFYQRQYSWDKEDVEKLMDDLYDGVKKICTKSDYLRFIGTVILLEEPNPQINQHFDTSGLITRIKNVIDGQQRLCTLAILSILLSEELLTIKKEIVSNKWDTLGSVPDLLTTIDNRILDLEEFYSLEVRKTNVNPERKPIIIRALNSNISPIVDQWTLNGDFRRYYQSDVAKFIAHYIENDTIFDDISNEKLIVVIKEIKQWLNKTRIGTNYPSAEELVGFNNRGSNLENFIDGVIDLQSLNQKNQDCYMIVCGAIKLLALLRFLTHKTFLTWIECPNEDLAFDMFQSLNATGTPLTAIEVFKPMVVNTLGQNYSKSDTKRYFDKIDEFFDAKKTSILKEKYTDEILMRFSLAYDGFELGKRFSEQRDYLTRRYSQIDSDIEKENFVHWLSDLSEYWDNVFIPRQPNRNSTNFPLAQYLVTLGLDLTQADLSALCIYYLKGANHVMAHYLLSVFHSKLLRSQSNPTKKAAAATEFFEICKTATAFFTLWGATVPGFPDDIYRFLFSQDRSNLSWKSGVINQNSFFVKEHFKKALEDKGVFALGSKSAAKDVWIKRAIVQLGYGKMKLCKFCLLISVSYNSRLTTIRIPEN